VRRPLVVVDEHRPGEGLEPLVLPRGLELLLVAPEPVPILPGMSLADADLVELDAVAVPAVQFLQRLN